MGTKGYLYCCDFQHFVQKRRIPISLYMEGVESENYRDYDQWMNYVVKCAGNDTLSYSMPSSAAYFYWDDGEYLYDAGWGWYEVGWTTGMRNRYYEAQPGNALLEACAGHGALLACGMTLYDRTTGDVANGDEVYGLGVALSVDLSVDNGFFNMSIKNYLNPDYHLNMQWPYEGTLCITIALCWAGSRRSTAFSKI